MLIYWTWVSRLYAAACIGEILAILVWHQQHPNEIGIPGVLMSLGYLPAWGPVILPLCMVVEGMLLWKRYRYLPSFYDGLALFACALLVSVMSFRHTPGL